MKILRTSILIVVILLSILACSKENTEPQRQEITDSLEIVNEKDTIEVPCESAYTEHNICNTGKTIRIYSAFTPNNYPFYDVIGDSASGKYRGKPITISEDLQDTSEIGYPNPDSIYNDDVNSYFYIENIEAFPYNKVFFYAEDTLIHNEPYVNCKNEKGTVFDGRYNRYIYVDGNLVMLPLYVPSGIYKYKIIIYEDPRWENLIDSVYGYFHIVRTPRYKTLGCRGKDEGDPLLMN